MDSDTYNNGGMQQVSVDIDFPTMEQGVLKFWDEIKAFETSLEQSKGKPEYTFYDGPPFATGLPHYGHILAGTIKDTVTRYAHQTGHHVTRRFGWDCHGLPIEFAIDEQLGIKTREQVFDYGVGKYNEACRGIVMTYSSEWEKIVHRLGRWIDMKNNYKTMDITFMESVWWVFSQLWEKGLVYRGFKVMPFSTACHTPLSNFEANLAYKDVDDPAITVMFPIIGDEHGASFLAWTTTPWTLPSNMALNVNPKMMYVKLQETKSGRHFVMLEQLVPTLFPEPKKKKADAPPVAIVVAKMLGSELVGKKYEPLFDFFEKDWAPRGAFRVCGADYVTADAGTGIVHSAPAFGADDFETCAKAGITRNDDIPCPVDDNGHFTEPVTPWLGQHVKAADASIIEALKAKGRVFKVEKFNHSYPFCWRSDTPLIYKAVPSWFVRVESLRAQMVEQNLKTYWVPQAVQEKRFHNWLEGAQDWCISRNRFWGTPIPIWQSEDGEATVVVSSCAQLQSYAPPGFTVTDLHMHNIDHITVPDPRGADRPPLKRIPEVFDCWFESGSMPFAQQHYPFENKDRFDAELFPADFIAEGLDQTRGWFYTLMVLSVALKGCPPFKNLVCNGLVLAEDGKKMSKRLKNYPDPVLVVDKYGADALRTYLINSPVVRAEPLNFREDGVKDVLRSVLRPWFNAYRFCVENCYKYQLDHKLATPFQVDMEKGVRDTRNVTDLWILSLTQSLLKLVRAEMAAYRLYAVVPVLLKHIEQLTNWYIRFNRKRFKGSMGQEEAFHGLCVLHFVLTQQTILMAPFTPFFAEYVYRNLRLALPPAQRTESVHFAMIPDPDESLVNLAIEDSMVKLQNVVELGRTSRDRRTLPVKTPLSTLHIVHSSAKVLEDLQPLLPYIKDELNVKNVVASTSETDFVVLVADIDDKALGPRLRNKKGAVKQAVKAFSDAKIREIQRDGRVEVEGFELSVADLQIVRQFQGDKNLLEPSWNHEVLIVLNVVVTEEMRAEGTARSVANVVQKFRKACGVVPTDELTIYYHVTVPGTGNFAKLLEEWGPFIAKKLGKPFLPIAAEDIAKHTYAGQEEVKSFGDCTFTIYVTQPKKQ